MVLILAVMAGEHSQISEMFFPKGKNRRQRGRGSIKKPTCPNALYHFVALLTVDINNLFVILVLLLHVPQAWAMQHHAIINHIDMTSVFPTEAT